MTRRPREQGHSSAQWRTLPDLLLGLAIAGAGLFVLAPIVWHIVTVLRRLA